MSKLSLAPLLVVLAQGPGALWAGSITPAIMSASVAMSTIPVARFSALSSDVWDAEFQRNELGDVWNYVQNCTAQRSQAVAVTSCPVPDHQAALLDSLRGATAWDNAVRNHTKPDSAAWTYTGRSFGMGAPQGLTAVQNVPSDYNILGYAYNEIGYNVKTSCRYNASSDLRFVLGGDGPNVEIWYLNGTMPNSIRPEFYPVMSWARASEDEAEILAWAAVATGDQYLVGITSSAVYGNFTNIQCSITFTPTVLAVYVNLTPSLMAVEATADVAGDMEVTGHLRQNAIWSINLPSRMSTSLYISIPGNALQNNLAYASCHRVTHSTSLRMQHYRTSSSRLNSSPSNQEQPTGLSGSPGGEEGHQS